MDNNAEYTRIETMTLSIIPKVNMKDVLTTTFANINEKINMIRANVEICDYVKSFGCPRISIVITHPFRVTKTEWLTLKISFNIIDPSDNVFGLRVCEEYVTNNDSERYISDRFMDIKTDDHKYLHTVLSDILKEEYCSGIDKLEYDFPMFNKPGFSQENCPSYCLVNDIDE